MLPKAGLFFLSLLVSTISTAQITGKIEDASDGSPLEYATATLFDQESQELIAGVITDIEGNFTFSKIKMGTYYLEASFIGYNKSVHGNITVQNGNVPVDLGAISLSIGDHLLDEVVLQAEQRAVINKIDRQVFNSAHFKNSQGGSAKDAIRNIPSVTVNGLGEINVRGSSGFVVLLNGNPVQGDPTTLLDQLPANSIEKIEVITAPSAKYDPEGKAGIFNIITRKEALNGSFMQVNLKGGFPSIENYGNAEPHQRYGLDGTYNFIKDNWNISLGANYQRNDLSGMRVGDVYTIINDTLTRFPSHGERSFDEVNYSGRFTIDFTPDTTNTYSLGFYAGKRSKDRTADILYFDNHAIAPAHDGERIYTMQYFNENLSIRKGDFILGSLDYSHSFNNTSKLETSFLYEYTLLGGPTTNRNLGYPDTATILQDEYNTNDNPLHGLRFQLNYIWNPFPFGQLETGYQFRSLDHKGNFIYQRRNNSTGEFELIPEFSSEVDLKRKLHSGYVQLNGNKGNWDYSAGGRIESMDRKFDLRDKTSTIDTTYSHDHLKLFPSASLQYTLKNNTKLKAAYSKRIERTTTFKMNPFPEREHSETLEQGDPTLKPEFIDLFELEATKNFQGGNSLYINVYSQHIKNLVNRVNTIYNDTILNRIYSNVGNARSLGLELGAQIKPTARWSNFIGANIYNYKIDGFFNEGDLNSATWVYSITANSTFDFSKTSSLQFTFNYLSDRNTAQGEDSRFYSPNLILRKTFFNDRLNATLQWQNIDLGLLNTNEQRITTFKKDEFYTTTNYIHEVDMIILNLSYTFNNRKNRSRFIDSEFGKNEF